MCGIAGVARCGPSGDLIDPAELARISAALAARGPDGEGEWRSPGGGAALAHRRLAILDLSPRGAQPMTSACGRYTMVFNGEIYDFREHREAMLRGGATFRSESDTELLLEMYALEGARAFGRVRGMFALAIWDERAQELVLARDPYGIKPLYYAVERGQLRFASQVRALEAGGRVSLEVDPGAVTGFLCWGSVPEPLTLRRAIRALPAGHLLRASAAGGFRIEPLPAAAGGDEEGSVSAAVAESVRCHLTSDVPVALFLSAGVDSALLAALARREQPEPPTAITLSVAEVRGTKLEEEGLARQVAATLGLRHVVREIGAAEVRALLPEVLAAMDQPSIDGFNTFLVARVARQEGFKVALSGLGADELLGGYASFADVPRWQLRGRALSRIPGLAAIFPALARRVSPGRPKLRGLLRHGTSLAGAYFLRRGLFLPEEVAALQGSAARTSYDPVLDGWERLGENILGSPRAIVADPWRAVHRMESTLYLKNQLLRDADWAGLAHGVEIRVPFVDVRLRAALERAGFEPARSRGKAALARQLAPELPAAVFQRAKSGFQLPIADWLAPAGASRPGSVGRGSRRLALHILEAFGIALPGAGR